MSCTRIEASKPRIVTGSVGSEYLAHSSISNEEGIFENNEGCDRDNKSQEFKGCLDKSEFPAIVDDMTYKLEVERIGLHSCTMAVARPFPVSQSVRESA
jgi:hypothetical protein